MAAAARTKVLIVGSGPAGLTAAIYTGRANLNPIVAAGSIQGSSIMPGGQLMITTEVENFPGFPKGISGPELMQNMFAQAKSFGAKVIEEFATEFKFKSEEKGDKYHKVKVGGTWYEAESVILANGAAARWLGLQGEEKFINKGISACATCDGPLPIFRGKDIYVLGGGDSACEEAMFLTKFAKHVYMIHRRDTLRASKIMAKRAIEHEKITVLWNSKINKYVGENSLEGLVLEDTKTGELRKVACGGLFMAIGHIPNTKHLQGSGVDLDKDGYVVVKDNVFTNLEGVFACGDNHDTIYRQAITASGFGCMAAITAERWLETQES